MSELYTKFNEMRSAFQTDAKENVIDYNWHVDGILKNSQSYNKDSKNVEPSKGTFVPTSIAIKKEDIIIPINNIS